MSTDIFLKYKKILIVVIINMLIVVVLASFAFKQFNQIELQQTKKDIANNKQQLLGLNKESLDLEKLITIDQFDLLKQIQTFKALMSMFDNLKSSADFEENTNNTLGQVFGVKGSLSSIVLLSYKVNNMIANGELKAQLTYLSIKNTDAALVLKIYGVVK